MCVYVWICDCACVRFCACMLCACVSSLAYLFSKHQIGTIEHMATEANTNSNGYAIVISLPVHAIGCAKGR